MSSEGLNAAQQPKVGALRFLCINTEVEQNQLVREESSCRVNDSGNYQLVCERVYIVSLIVLNSSERAPFEFHCWVWGNVRV